MIARYLSVIILFFIASIASGCQNKNGAEALDETSQALVINDCASTLYAAKQTGDIDISDNAIISIFRYTINLDPSYNNAYYNMASALVGAGEYCSAISVLNDLMKIYPNDADAMNIVGLIRAEYTPMCDVQAH